MRYFLGKDPFSGISRWMEHDPVTDITTEYAEADISHEVEASKQMQNNPDIWKQGVKDEFAFYGHVPAILLEKWALEGVNINDTQALFKMINRPEYSYLKTTTKTHG
jgi:hypothetical protein